MEQRTAEWYEARRGLVTASSVGAILGHDPYRDRDDVMRAMVRECHLAEPEFTGNIATQYGERHEDDARFHYMLESGSEVDEVGFVMREGWAGCSPDGLVGLVGGLEIKCPFGKRKMSPADAFKPLREQPHYYDQVQFSLWVCERAWWDFFQWAPGATSLERVTPDASWRSQYLHKLAEFHDEYVEECEKPNAQKHLEPRRVEINNSDARRLLAEYDELCDAIDNATARKKELLDNIIALAEGRDALICERKLTRIERAGSVAYAKVVKDHLPEIDLEPYRGKPSEYWTLKG